MEVPFFKLYSLVQLSNFSIKSGVISSLCEPIIPFLIKLKEVNKRIMRRLNFLQFSNTPTNLPEFVFTIKTVGITILVSRFLISHRKVHARIRFHGVKRQMFS